MLLKKKYKYLFVVSEYGSTNIILGLIKKYKINRYNFYNIDKKIDHKYIKKEIPEVFFVLMVLIAWGTKLAVVKIAAIELTITSEPINLILKNCYLIDILNNS